MSEPEARIPQTPPEARELAVQLRAEMVRQGISIPTMAGRIGLTARQLRYRFTTGTLSTVDVYRLADVLGVPVSVLVSRATATEGVHATHAPDGLDAA